MTDEFGGQTVVFVTVTEDPGNRDRYNRPIKVRTTSPVSGCRFRPLDASEAIAVGDLSFKKWKLTAPPVSAVLNAVVTDEVEYNGETFQVAGDIRPFTDMEGRLFKVTVMCERREG